MLEELRVSNFAVIEKTGIKFGQGLNVITGETGAGKSIMIQAITGLIGGRLDQSVIRTGENKAAVEGMFRFNDELIDDLKEIDLMVENPIIIRRIVGARRAGYINDSPVTIQTLRSLGNKIIELLGQHEQQSLFKVENHRRFLDSFLRINGQLKQMSLSYDDYIRKKNDFENYLNRMEKLKEKKELLTFQLNEIEAADLKPGEEDILTRELNLLKTAEKRRLYISEILHYFYDDKDSAYELLSRVADLLAKLSLVDPKMKGDYDEMQELLIHAEELGREITSYKEDIEYSQERVDEVIGRLEAIKKLNKKYGSLEEIEKLTGLLRKELSEITDYPVDLEKKQNELKEAGLKLDKLARKLSKKRRAGAARLKRRVEQLLRELKINAHFVVNCDEIPIGRDGIDRIEFYVSANPGEEPKPLRKVASGGELSRIVLVLKSILANLDQVPILIFDEIDSGIGGRVGETVGKKLAELARHHQVICITHLPQIAKFADHHFLVEKNVRNKRTYTRLKLLDDNERISELARMIGGNRVTDLALKKAQEMLKEASCLRSQT